MPWTPLQFGFRLERLYVWEKILGICSIPALDSDPDCHRMGCSPGNLVVGYAVRNDEVGEHQSRASAGARLLLRCGAHIAFWKLQAVARAALPAADDSAFPDRAWDRAGNRHWNSKRLHGARGV